MDEQVELLRGIWNEIKALNGRVDGTNQRLDATNQRLDATNQRLDATNQRLDATNQELGATNRRLDATNQELEASNRRLDATNDRLDAMRRDLKAEMIAMRTELVERIDLVHSRSVDRDLRLGTTMAELSRDVRELTLVVHDWRDEHRLDRADLRARIERLERYAGF